MAYKERRASPLGTRSAYHWHLLLELLDLLCDEALALFPVPDHHPITGHNSD
ncbi:MAG: hypothetical protein ACE5HK_06275 [Candidatus Methylomirabilales bacterium]